MYSVCKFCRSLCGMVRMCVTVRRCKTVQTSAMGRLIQSSTGSFLHRISVLMNACVTDRMNDKLSLIPHLLGSCIVQAFLPLLTVYVPALRTRRTALASQSPSSAYLEWWGWSNSWAEGRGSGLCCGPSLNPSRWGCDTVCLVNNWKCQ